MKRSAGVFSSSLALTLGALMVLGSTGTALATTIYDDFEGDSLNTSLWTPATTDTGSVTVANSILTLASPVSGSGSVLSTGTWGYNTFQFTVAGIFGGRDGFGINGGGQFAVVRSDLGGSGNANWKFHVYTGSGSEYKSGVIAAPAAGDLYEIVWKADSVELRKNGNSVITETSVVPTTTVLKSFQMFTYGGEGAQAAYHSVGVVPEPATISLLATASIGLLCYAWRKRR